MDAPVSAKAAILAILAQEGAGYGSQLIEQVEKMTSGMLSLHAGSVYPALVALEREGFVKRRSDMRTGSVFSTRACYFELTRKGRLLLEEHRRIVASIYQLQVFLDTEVATPTLMACQ